jgi:hypothetical protein
VALSLDWEQGQPLTPFEQLLACLPPRSANLLPEPYSFLMNDPRSPILEYYPKDFRTDLNGKKNDYEAVVLLPFIDVGRLKAAESEFVDFSLLDEDTRNRNGFGNYHVYHANAEEKVFVPTIDHGVAFEPVLSAGTTPQLFWPSLPEILSASHSLENRDFFGRTVYVSGGGGRGGHGRGGGRGDGRGHDRHGGKNDHHRHNDGGLPMPGVVSEPHHNNNNNHHNNNSNHH